METKKKKHPMLVWLDRVGLDQKDLAKKIGVSKATVTYWVQGETLPNARFLAKLAAALKVPVDDLCRKLVYAQRLVHRQKAREAK